MLREVSLAAVIGELERDNMLPAIMFRTSRSQCDADITHAARNRRLLLDRKQQQRLKNSTYEIIQRYQMEEQLITEHPHYSTLVTTGIGAHHAGQLLMWRLLLEELMQRGLLRVLVATGTVAAGVDFPARTVVITAHSRRGSEGFRNFTSSEFQQMSGRAGRRGRDTVGFCVVAPSRFCDARPVLEIAGRPPEPLTSAYFPSPSTVLNLLKFRNADDLVYTVDRSLAAFVDRKNASRLRDEAMKVDSELESGVHGNEESRTVKRLRKKSRRLRGEADDLDGRQVSLLNKALVGMRELGFVEGDNLSEKGQWASNICTNLVLELSEIIESGLLNDASPERLVSVVASLAGDSHRKYMTGKNSPLSSRDLEILYSILKRVRTRSIPGVLESSEEDQVMVDSANTVLMWMHAVDWQEFRGLLTLMQVHEGDVARLITQTGEHLNQLTRLSHTHPDLARKAEIARLRIIRPPLTEGLESVF